MSWRPASGAAPCRAANNGYPVRLVAPGKRGFEWVKWVTAIEVNDSPKWLPAAAPVAVARRGGGSTSPRPLDSGSEAGMTVETESSRWPAYNGADPETSPPRRQILHSVQNDRGALRRRASPHRSPPHARPLTVMPTPPSVMPAKAGTQDTGDPGPLDIAWLMPQTMSP